MMKTPQEKIQEILDKCSTGNCIFRGENKEYDKTSSGLYRQYCQLDNDNPTNGSSTLINNEHFSVFSVEKDIVDKVKRHLRPGASNIEVLTELQHYGGKTALLDFTKDIHIALFFACDGNFGEDGRVILFETSTLSEKIDIDYDNLDENRGKNIYTLISPIGKDPRIVFQSSVFVHTSKGYLETDNYGIIKIEQNIKKPLLDYLSKHFNIKTETIYNDIQGFIQNQHNYSNAEIEFYRGWTKQQERKYDEAIECYSKAIELDPQPVTYSNRGNAHSDLSQYEKAIEDHNKAIEIDPQYATAYNNRGNERCCLGQYEKSIEDYDKAIEIDPQDATAYNNRGNARCCLGQYEKSIKDYDKAIELNPQYGNAYNNRGSAHFHLGQYEKSIKDYDKAIEIDPQYATAYNNRGNARCCLGQYEKSIKDYDKAIELNPQYGNAYNNRGSAHFHLGQYEKSIKDYDKAIEIDPQYATAYNNRGNARCCLGQYEKSIKDYDKAIELNPQFAIVYCNRGIANADLGRYEEAMQDYTEAKKLYEKEGNIEKAEEYEKQITHLKNLMAGNGDKNH